MIDLEKYAKKFVVKVCTCPGEHFGDRRKWLGIHGKRGYIIPWGENELEVYVSNTRIASRIERIYKQFKPRFHYDDATAFVFGENDIFLAAKLIQAKKRRQMTPESLERLARMRSLIPKARQNRGITE